MFSWEALSFMTSTIGYPVHLHPETLACSNFEKAKIFVNVDISKSLPKEIEFVIEGKEFTTEFYYPWLPARCNLCEKWGHNEKVCAAKKKGKKQDKVVDTVEVCAAAGDTDEVCAAAGDTVEDTPVKVLEEGCEIKAKDDKVEVSEKENSGTKVAQSNDKEKENVWSKPGKVGRASSRTPNREEVEMISASKYSLLSVVDVEEGEIQKETQLETEEENIVEEEEQDIREGDYIEDEILDQQTKEKEKSGGLKGGKKAQKPKAQGANPKSKRSSRRKL